MFKPGGIVKEDWCTICQCINNAYVCDDSSCHHKSTTERIGFTTQEVEHTTTFEELTTIYREINNNISTENKYTTGELLTTKEYTTEYLSTIKWPESSTLRPLIISTSYTPEELFSSMNTEKTTEEIIFVPSTVSSPLVLCDVNQ